MYVIHLTVKYKEIIYVLKRIFTLFDSNYCGFKHYCDVLFSNISSIGFHQMGGEEAMDRYNICIGSNLTCMNVIMNQMGQFDHVDHHGEQMKCR